MNCFEAASKVRCVLFPRPDPDALFLSGRRAFPAVPERMIAWFLRRGFSRLVQWAGQPQKAQGLRCIFLSRNAR
jgi:hypothetical protein